MDYDPEKNDAPIRMALHTFNGYWNILSKLAELLKMNFITKDILPDFDFILRSCLQISTPSISLNYQELFNINLTGANLTGANLSGANLTGANLKSVILYNANLSYANLSYTDLSGADLYRAILEEADLSETNLYKIDIREIVLEKAIFKGCKIDRRNFLRLKKRLVDTSSFEVIN